MRYFALFLCLFVGACGSSKGVREFQLYTQAFDYQVEAGNTVLDSVARAERIVALRRIKRRGEFSEFRPEEAAYWVDTVQPPITDSIRSSISSLKTYNNTLSALANGEKAEALANKLGQLSSDLISAGASITIAVGGPTVVTGSNALLKQLLDEINVLLPAIKLVAVRAGREAFRKLLIETYPTMREFQKSLRDSTPVMFELLKRGRATRGSFEPNAIASTADAENLRRERELLAGWVLLMDKSLIAMETAYLAAKSDALLLQDVSAVGEAAIELRVTAEQIKSTRSK